MELQIRACTAADAVALESDMPLPDYEHFRHWLSQRFDEVTYLVATDFDRPVGHVLIRWNGSVHEQVRTQIGVMPEIRRLRVHPDRRRNGVAEALMERSERLIADRGFERVGLAVALENVPARNLYEGRDYLPAGVDTFVSAHGISDEGERITHRLSYLVRELASRNSETGRLVTSVG